MSDSNIDAAIASAFLTADTARQKRGGGQEDIWQQALRNTLERILASGTGPDAASCGYHTWTEHAKFIRAIAVELEEKIRRILSVCPADEIAQRENLLRRDFAAFLDQCILRSSKNLGIGSGADVFPRKARVVGAFRSESSLLRSELAENFSLMIMETKKHAAPPAGNTTYIVSGIGAKVNINSTDRSRTTINVTPHELFERIRGEVRKLPEAEQPAINEAIAQMEKAGEDKSVLLGAYGEFTRLITNHASIFSAYVPAIAQLFMS